MDSGIANVNPTTVLQPSLYLQIANLFIIILPAVGVLWSVISLITFKSKKSIFYRYGGFILIAIYLLILLILWIQHLFYCSSGYC